MHIFDRYIRKIFILTIGTWLLIGCFTEEKGGHPGTKQRPKTQAFTPGKISEQLICSTSGYYRIYLPNNYSNEKKWPVIYFFDPGGNGGEPLARYQLLADQFGFILIGSMTSRNGVEWDEINAHIRCMIDQTIDELNISTHQIFLSGFSGGARVATRFAEDNGNIKGVVGCGAGLWTMQRPPANPYRYLTFVGNEDFNFVEMYRTSAWLKKYQFDHFLRIFEGGHDWPDTTTFRSAFTWATLICNSEDLRDWQERQTAQNKKVINDPVDLQSILLKEFRNQQDIAMAYERRDFDKLYENARSFITHSMGGFDKDQMNKRLLKYMSMLAYIYGNKMIKSKQAALAEEYLNIYLLVDAENPDCDKLRKQLRELQSK